MKKNISRIAAGILSVLALSFFLITYVQPPAAGNTDQSTAEYSTQSLPESAQKLLERSLIPDLKKMQTVEHTFDSSMPIRDAQLFLYEFYATHPEISLCYSPRFDLLAYKSDAKICTGCRYTFISDDSGEIRYQELQQVTEPVIYDLENKSDREKVTFVKLWIRDRCSYTKTPNNMWDECLYGCLVKGDATCLGYSEGFMYMMDRLQVPCRIVRDDHHAWNEVCVDGRWEKADLTNGI